MATNFYLKSIDIENFRAFNKLSVPKLRRINVIGGFNGAGKTAFLETVFLALDIKFPLSIIKPIMWRSLPIGSSEDLRMLIKDVDSTGRVKLNTRDGELSIEIRFGAPPPNLHVAMAAKASATSRSSSWLDTTSAQVGLDVRAKLDGKDDQAFYVSQEGSELNANVYQSTPRAIALGQIIGGSVKPSSTETAQRVSTILKMRKLQTLINFVSIVQPKIKSLSVLQFAADSNVYAEMEDGELLPVQFLGDGFVSLLTIGAGLMTAAGGVLLLDEVDHALHHTLVERAWKGIAEFAEQQNCQVFVTTHSREAIIGIAKGVSAAERSKDFQYLRFEVDQESRDHRCITYSADDVIAAASFDSEIR